MDPRLKISFFLPFSLIQNYLLVRLYLHSKFTPTFTIYSLAIHCLFPKEMARTSISWSLKQNKICSRSEISWNNVCAEFLSPALIRTVWLTLLFALFLPDAKNNFNIQQISIDRSKMSEEEAFEHAIDMIQTRQMGFRKAADFFSVSFMFPRQ